MSFISGGTAQSGPSYPEQVDELRAGGVLVDRDAMAKISATQPLASWQDALGRNERALAEMNMIVSWFEDKLQPIMRSEAGPVGNPERDRYPTTISEEIGRHTDSLMQLSMRLDQLRAIIDV